MITSGGRHLSRPNRLSSEDVRAALWFPPLAVALVSLLVTLALLEVRPGPQAWASWAWPADAQTAATLMSTVATVVMTALTLSFSLTVVALQLSSQQFSPRLLREFARDRVIQAVLAVLICTFVVSLTGLRGLEPQQPLPVLVVLLAQLLGLASALAVLVFVAHIVKALRVDTMMVSVHGEAAENIVATYPPYGDTSQRPAGDVTGAGPGTTLTFPRSGFVRVVGGKQLAEIARRHDVTLRLGVRPGDAVVQGSPLARVWPRNGRLAVDPSDLTAQLLDAVELGFERTAEQDSALGLRQLADIAVKAISPGINDPVTAVHAVGYCGDLLVRLQGRELGEQGHADEDGVLRVETPDRDHRYYLDLVCAPVRRYGRSEPLVLTALLRMLRDCGLAARDDEQRGEIARQASLVVAQMSSDLLEDDADAVRDAARRVCLALDGQVDLAYEDRAGETRSV